MSMIQAIKSVFGNYANFKGRARRSEYWFFALFMWLIGILMCIPVWLILKDILADHNYSISSYYEYERILEEFISRTAPLMLLDGLIGLATLIPGLAVSVRRLHDRGYSGTFLLFAFIPAVGVILLLVWFIQDGMPGGNLYGPDPKGRSEGQGYPPSPYNPPAQQQGGNIGGYAQPPMWGYNGVPVLRAEGGVFGGRSFQIQGRLSMGRNPDNTVVFPQNTQTVSRRHCEFTMNNGKLFVQDAGSTNGTVINGSYRLMPGQTVELNPGDRVSLGSMNDTFVVS